MTKEELEKWQALSLPYLQKKKLTCLVEQGADIVSIRILTRRTVGKEVIYMTVDEFGRCVHLPEQT